MKKAILVATIGAMTLGVNAGDWGKAPVDKTPIVECVDIGGEVSVGYMSNYIFRGVEFAGDSVWSDVNYTFDGLAIPITIGALYLNGINDGGGGFGFGGFPGTADFDELDLYVSAALGTFAGFDVSLGYTHRTYPESRAGNPGVLAGPPFLNAPNRQGFGEINLGITRSLGFVDMKFSANSAMGGGGFAPNGFYYELGLEKSFGLTDNISLVLGGGVAYSDNYFQGLNNFPNVAGFVGGVPVAGLGGALEDSGWNHYYLTASLPIVLNCRTTLTPYVGFNGAPDGWVADGINGSTTQALNNGQSDILHGGVTLSVTF